MARAWLVTGCSRGFGRALAEAVLDAGDNLLATGRDPATREELGVGRPGRFVTAPLDITDEVQAPAAVSSCCDRLLRSLEVLVNNACYGDIGSVEDTPIASFRRQIETDLFGTIIITKPPLRLPSGSDAVTAIAPSDRKGLGELERWRPLSISSDFAA